MSDSEERPFKMRKLDPPAELLEPAQIVESVSEPTCENGAEHAQNQEEIACANPKNNEAQETASQDLPLSKSQLKKLRRQEQWEAGKEYRKIKRREKQKAKKARKADERADFETKIASGELAGREPPKKKGPARPIQLPVTFILDCEFEDFMNEKELISLGAQITRCYSENKSMPYRSHMVISSWNGNLKERFETVLINHHLGWKGVRFIEGDFVAAAKEMDEVTKGPTGGRMAGAFSLPEAPVGSSEAIEVEDSGSDSPRPVEATPTPSMVYLTSDSPHTLERLSPNTSYIIGGIVDKNRHKGLCYKRACERGIPTAKLPIGKYMTMQGRSVLTVNHVMEIMLHWLESGDWGNAFVKVIPKRKEARLKANSWPKGGVDSEGTNNEYEDDAEDKGDEASDAEHDEESVEESDKHEGAPGPEHIEGIGEENDNEANKREAVSFKVGYSQNRITESRASPEIEMAE